MFTLPFNIPWKAMLAVGVGILLFWGFQQTKSFYLEQLKLAENRGRDAVLLVQKEAIRQREEELSIISKEEKKQLEIKIQKEQKKVDKLEKMLLVEHDLERLLQAKPGLILSRVNKGTVEYNNQLKEITSETD